MKASLSKAAVAVLCLAVGQVALADPCGMVPPIRVDVVNPIVRTGVQKTYVAYSGDTETMVLRPGFTGKVDEFGMLIPFPSSPAIRKVDDNMFPHIAAAIDPPEVQAWVRRAQRWPTRARRSMAPSAAKDEAMAEPTLGYDTVKVLKQEAVGMYEVAVLAAGSANALKKWMDQHEFKYPDGMDEVVQDYVEIRWVFVAIKTKVGQKNGVNPVPGMRDVNSKLPGDATFNGFVQAMGFRFKSDELVVPMRLSAFNKGELRNIVYILTDDAQRIDDIPKRYVVRQVPGREIYRNLTSPLPLRVYGGTINQLTPQQIQQLSIQRNPEPHNGLAKELFSSDLLAFKKKRLANPYEEEEKELLAIGEALGLRGPALDKLHADALKRKRERAQKNVLANLNQMTLTIVDGDFDRDTIAKQNLTFSDYKMSTERNNTEAYDARRQGPGIANPGGKLYRTELVPQRQPKKSRFMWGLLLFGLGGIVVARRRKGVKILAASALVGVIGAATLPVSAKLSNEALIEQLGDETKRDEARAALVKRGDAAVDDLLDAVYDGNDLIVRGWAITALAEIGGKEVDEGLTAVHQSGHVPALVRTWAAAGRVSLVDSVEDLAKVSALGQSFPALARPLKLRATALVSSVPTSERAEALLSLMATNPNLSSTLQAAVLALPPESLISAMMTSKNQTVRQWSASYLGTQANQGNASVKPDFIEALSFERKAKDVPWAGGPLYLPGVAWTADEAKTLADNLIRWHVWAEKHDADPQIQRQIHNNLNQYQLYNSAGYPAQPANASTEQWLEAWGKVQGRNHIYWMLRQQGLEREARFKAVLDRL